MSCCSFQTLLRFRTVKAPADSVAVSTDELAGCSCLTGRWSNYRRTPAGPAAVARLCLVNWLGGRKLSEFGDKVDIVVAEHWSRGLSVHTVQSQTNGIRVTMWRDVKQRGLDSQSQRGRHIVITEPSLASSLKNMRLYQP